MASHPLDNPVWNALTGPQASLAIVHARFRRYQEEIGLFAAVEDTSAGIEGVAAAIPVGMVQAS
jgi:hypothetical protein